MKRHTMMLLAAGAIWLPAAQAQDAQALLKKDGCLKCHSVSSDKDGPSYKSVAARYQGKADAAATLQAALKSGKIGKEGKHAAFKGSDAELKSVVDYILSR